MPLRPDLLDPHRDDPRLEPVVTLARLLFALHAAGGDLTEPLGTLSRLSKRTVRARDVAEAADAMGHETFARELLTADPPADLADDELLELIRRVGAVEGTEFQLGFWMSCLESATGDDRIGDLIHWPGAYFGDGDDGRALTPREILDTARASGRDGRR